MVGVPVAAADPRVPVFDFVGFKLSHGPAVIQTKKPLKALSDLKGRKIRVPGGVGSLVGKALGVTAVKLFKLLSRYFERASNKTSLRFGIRRDRCYRRSRNS